MGLEIEQLRLGLLVYTYTQAIDGPWMGRIVVNLTPAEKKISGSDSFLRNVVFTQMKGVLQIKGASGREKKAPKELESILNRYFGYSEFRGKQLEAIEVVLSGLLAYCACVSLYLYWLALVLLRCFQHCGFCLIC